MMTFGTVTGWFAGILTRSERAPSIGSWTPGVRALIRGRTLRCGCLAGLYETSSGQCVEMIDAVDGGCSGEHFVNCVLSRTTTPAL